jgi:hypothetical protein
VQILKRGRGPAPRHFRSTCGHCGCEFQFNSLDKGVSVEHKGPCDDWVFVNCPECNVRMTWRLPHPGLVETEAPPAAARVAPVRAPAP